MSKILPELLYSESHEWVKADGDIAIIGVTDFAQSELGDITYVDLPSEGDSFAAGECFGALESVKTAADLYCPVGGEVVAVNNDLEDDPAAVNTDPYGSWIIKVKIADSREFASLLNAAAYEKIAK